MLRPLTVLSAPSNLGLMPPANGREPGVRRMPTVLLAHGLLDGLAVQSVATVAPPPYGFGVDPETGVRNAEAIRAYTLRLATTIEAAVAGGSLVVVLGGDCSILLGAMLGLRRWGDVGLIFVDGHRDFQTPETSATGGAAGMDLALATGRGPALLTHFDGAERLVRDEAVVVLGHRDQTSGVADGSSGIEGTSIARLDLDAIRQFSPAGAAAEALAVIQRSGAAGFWIHVDADVLSSDVMPAVDSPQPGGLSYDELRALLVPLLQSDLAMGLEVTIYDPDRDPSGEVGRAFAACLRGVLAEAGGAARDGA